MLRVLCERALILVIGVADELEEAEGNRQPGATTLQGTVPDAEHRLRDGEEEPTRVPGRLQEVRREERQGNARRDNHVLANACLSIPKHPQLHTRGNR